MKNMFILICMLFFSSAAFSAKPEASENSNTFPTESPQETADKMKDKIEPEDQSSSAVTTESIKDRQEVQQKIPPCPATDPKCNDKQPDQESPTDAPTTRSKQEAQKIQQHTPSCPVNNPNCNDTK